MKNKELQEKRMKEYFIQATKSILKGEGIKALSVRNIADQAGYSYTTLYNYFKDVNDLIFLCVNDFQEECKSFVEDSTPQDIEGIDRLKSTVLAYINYFVEYPGIFDLFYLTKVGDFGNKQNTIDLISKSLENVCTEDWNYCTKHNIFTGKKLHIIKSQLKYTVVGLLLYYINRRIPVSYTDFINQVNSQIDNILMCNKSNLKTPDLMP